LNGVFACISLCGNGIIDSPYETCDNTDFSDWCCASNCQSYEPGYSLNPSGIANSTCSLHCCTNPSDGIVAGNEVCDDGNTIAGDGCYNNQIESGWTCVANATDGSVCSHITSVAGPFI